MSIENVEGYNETQRPIDTLQQELLELAIRHGLVGF